MTSTPCRICGNTAKNREHTALEMMFGLREPFQYVECGDCGCVQISEPPVDLARFYPPQYLSRAIDFDREFAAYEKRLLRGLTVAAILWAPNAFGRLFGAPSAVGPLRALSLLRPRPWWRILDVGSGSGRLLYLMRLAGFRRTLGIDPFLSAPIHYENGLKILKQELAQTEGGWDVIMLHHALEHIQNQRATLMEIRQRLTPDGRCLIRIPVADCEAWGIYGTDWVQLDAPRHFFLHTRRSLSILAEATGFRIEHVQWDSYNFQFWGSEQYRQGVPLMDDRSYRWGAGPDLFGPAQLEAWARRSELLNRTGRGDQAMFILRPHRE